MPKIVILLFICFIVGRVDAQSIGYLRKEFYSSDKNVLKNAEALVDFYHDESPDSLKNIGLHLLDLGFRLERMDLVYYGKMTLSAYYTKHGQPELSLENLNECIIHYQKMHDGEKLADCYNKKGLAFMYLNKEKDAIDCFLKSLNIAEKLPEDNESYMAQINMSEAFYRMGDYASAWSEANSFEQKVRKQKLNKGLRRAFDLKGKIAFAENKIIEGVDYYRKSLKLAYENGDKLGLSFAKNNMAIAYFQLGQNELAKECFEQSLVLRKSINNPSMICESYFNLGEYYYGFEDYGKAISYYDSTIAIAKKNHLLLEQIDALSRVSECLRKKGKFENALDKMEIVVALKDSLLRKSKKDEVDLLADYGSYRLKSKTLQQRQREKVLEQRLLDSQKKNVKIIVLGGILISLLVYGYFSKAKKLN